MFCIIPFKYKYHVDTENMLRCDVSEKGLFLMINLMQKQLKTLKFRENCTDG